jgi:DNA-directed RNA polymerase specialized sigma24 family protein
MVRRRVPAGEVDDVIQATLTEALASATAPAEAEALRRWVFGIARHKVADLYRRSRREMPTELPELEAQSAPHSASDLLRWAEKALPEGENAEKTLEWMLREGEGEKLESIAESEAQPAPRVRQRVARLRKHFRATWAAQVAAAATLLGLAALVWWTLHRPPVEAPIAREIPADPAIVRGQELRRMALERCGAQSWDDCLKGLDDAKQLDPAGDADETVSAARKAAADARAPTLPQNALPQNALPQNALPPNAVPAPSGRDATPPLPSSRVTPVAPPPPAQKRTPPPHAFASDGPPPVATGNKGPSKFGNGK